MLKELWVIAALFNVDGFEFKKEMWDHSYKTAGECSQAILDLQRSKTHKQYECFRSWNGSIYDSQPSWMSNDAAQALVDKYKH